MVVSGCTKPVPKPYQAVPPRWFIECEAMTTARTEAAPPTPPLQGVTVSQSLLPLIFLRFQGVTRPSQECHNPSQAGRPAFEGLGRGQSGGGSSAAAPLWRDK